MKGSRLRIVNRLPAFAAVLAICFWPMFASGSCCCQKKSLLASSDAATCCAPKNAVANEPTCSHCLSAAESGGAPIEATEGDATNTQGLSLPCSCDHRCCDPPNLVTVPAQAGSSVDRGLTWDDHGSLLAHVAAPVVWGWTRVMTPSRPIVLSSVSRCALLCRWLK